MCLQDMFFLSRKSRSYGVQYSTGKKKIQKPCRSTVFSKGIPDVNTQWIRGVPSMLHFFVVVGALALSVACPRRGGLFILIYVR